MTAEVPSPPGSPHRGASWNLARVAAPAGLLLIEALAIGLRFEGVEASFAGGRWWSPLLAESHSFFNVFLLSAGSAALFGGQAAVDEFRNLARASSSRRTAAGALLAHLAAYLIFFALTYAVIEGGVAGSQHPGAWVAAWFVAGVASLATLLSLALPPAWWPSLLRRCWGALAIGSLVGVVSWLTGQYTLTLWKPFHRLTFLVVSKMLDGLVPGLVSDPATARIGTEAFNVTIHPSCSGYEGIGLIWVFVGAYLWHARGELRYPVSLVLLPLGTVLIWLANALRIAALVLIGVHASPQVALGGFHSQGGWIGFLTVSLVLFMAARHWPFVRSVEEPSAAAAVEPNPAVPYLAPLFALLTVMTLTTAFSSGFDRLYPIRVAATGVVAWHFRRDYLGIARGWSWSWEPAVAGVAVFLVWMALEPPSRVAPEEGATLSALMNWPTWLAATWVMFRVGGSVVTAPIAEELAFRGYLARRLIERDFDKVPLGAFTWWSFLASSVGFGLLHGRWIAGTIAGLIYAGALYRRRNLADPVLAHAITNAMIAGAVLLGDRWTLWE